MVRTALAFLTLLLGSCASDSGPESVSQTSIGIPKLDDRIRFVESYVSFRRTYTQLEYDVVYHNNGTGRGVPGPSDWNIRLVAEVPENQIDEWILPNALKAEDQKTDWYKEVAHEIDVSNVNEWYTDQGRTVGIDRVNSIIVYRNQTQGM